MTKKAKMMYEGGEEEADAPEEGEAEEPADEASAGS